MKTLEKPRPVVAVAPMMDWTDTLQRRGFPGVWYANGAGILWAVRRVVRVWC